MTTDALERLIQAVEAGTLGNLQVLDCGVPFVETMKAYSGDLNAAKALHDALMPGWIWQKSGGEISVQKWSEEHSHTDYHNPARAWLLAILKARLAEGDSHE